MSGASSPHSGLTRRSFLKASGAAAGTFGLVGAAGMLTADEWLAPLQAHAEPKEHVAYLCHQFHCLSGCCLKCTARDGRLVLIEPNDAVDKDDRRICLRGISEVQHVYSIDRIQTPLRRVGERGEGVFEAITWDEAITTIADAVKEAQEKYGESAFFFRKSTEASVAHGFEFLPALLHADTGSKWGLDRGQANGFDPGVGAFAFLPSNSMAEWSKASTIINLGNNLLESGITWSKALFEAKEAGATVITIDPRFSPTASKSHQWIPVKPGADAALVLGMIQCIIDRAWYDEEFMVANTSMPFLVDEKTGVVLGKTEEIVDEVTGEATEVKVPLVWNAATAATAYCDEEGIAPALEGSHTVDGIQATTEFDLLKKQMAPYTLAWASETTGLDEEVIEGLADRYANGGPAIINFGLGGPDKYTNADILGHALAVVTALTGNYGKEGTGTGFYGAGGAFHAGEMKAWSLPEEFVPGDTGLAMYDMPYTDNNVHVALTFGDAFTLEAADANRMLEWVKGLDFFAICDIYHSSAVDYADIVLPACTKFESEEDVTVVRDSKNYIALGQKVIDPLFESKSDLQIERLLAKEWGYEGYLPETYEELARHMLSEVSDNMEGITFEALQNNQGVMRLVGSEEQLAGHREQIYATPTTKMELYYEDLLEEGQAFPHYENPNEAYDENAAKEQYPLVFMQGKTRFRIHAYYSASSWLQEYYGPHIDMSSEDAAARGIADGDDVEVFNGRGSFVCRAVVNAGIQQGTLFMAETTYNHYYKEGFLQNVTNAHRQERAYKLTFGPQIPYNDTLVEVKKA